MGHLKSKLTAIGRYVFLIGIISIIVSIFTDNLTWINRCGAGVRWAISIYLIIIGAAVYFITGLQGSK